MIFGGGGGGWGAVAGQSTLALVTDPCSTGSGRDGLVGPTGWPRHGGHERAPPGHPAPTASDTASAASAATPPITPPTKKRGVRPEPTGSRRSVRADRADYVV